MRLDQFLAGKVAIRSRVHAKRLIQAGNVRVNRTIAKKAAMDVMDMDTVEWKDFPAPKIPKIKGKATPLPVLYQDAHCMVIFKPAGLTVHPGSGMAMDEETVLSALKALFSKRRLPFSEAAVLVHRLDKDTTGCLLVAKNAKAHQKLQKQFEDRSVSKFYLALVSGVPSPAAAKIDAPIGRHTSMRTKMSVHQASAMREATTTYHVLGSAQSISLLSCELHTGRTHQIRVHLQSIGHPVLGDPTYANGTSKSRSAKLKIDFLCLHAWKIGFVSPNGKKVTVTCPPPKNFLKVLKKLKIAAPK